MTSGPEDIVKRLIDHLESQAGTDAAGQPDAALRGGAQTARILTFAPGRSLPPRLAGAKGGVVDFARARKTRAAARL